MKTTIITVLSLIFTFFNSCGQDFMELSDDEINKIQLNMAEEFANSYLTTLKEGSVYDFKDEAIDAFKNQLTPETQKDVYKQLKTSLGDFQSLKYAESWTTGGGDFIIHRFKGAFSESSGSIEIRVVMNKSDKIAGFWIKPWNDKIK